MNKVILIGNLTKDPELSQTPSSVDVAKFTIATQRKFSNADGQRETDFINCVAWRTTGKNIASYFKKGEKIAVIGSLQSRNYETNDGTKRTVFEVIVDEFEFVQSKNQAEKSNENDLFKQDKTKLEPVDIDDDDLPF